VTFQARDVAKAITGHLTDVMSRIYNITDESAHIPTSIPSEVSSLYSHENAPTRVWTETARDLESEHF
jgi:hypothetical protein